MKFCVGKYISLVAPRIGHRAKIPERSFVWKVIPRNASREVEYEDGAGWGKTSKMCIKQVIIIGS